MYKNKTILFKCWNLEYTVTDQRSHINLVSFIDFCTYTDYIKYSICTVKIESFIFAQRISCAKT